MRWLPSEIWDQITATDLVECLRQAFQQEYTVPPRPHYSIGENTLLLMPAWQVGKYAGVKMVTVAPKHQPSIQGIYTLLDAATGTPLAQMDARLLTAKRTAAASALASSYLSREKSSSLLLVGTGTLAPHLIEAHRGGTPHSKCIGLGEKF